MAATKSAGSNSASRWATSVSDLLFAVNDLARPALEFIADTGAFYVRELPGGLEDDEKLALAAALVECKVLRSAS